jgi:hypothetical protein
VVPPDAGDGLAAIVKAFPAAPPATGSYFPPPVKAVPIPKKTGGVRVLGVPTVADRVAQTVVKLWLISKPRSRPSSQITITGAITRASAI